MPILLVRHGDALPTQTTDEERILSLAGRAEVRALAGRLRQKGLVPDAVVSSPLVRAVQTAELLAGALGYAGLASVEPALAPGGDPWQAESYLRSQSGLVLAVTHEPIVRVIAAQLVGQPTFPAFRTAGCVLVDQGGVKSRFDP
jgi:phosphohistidine phosphatase